MAKGRLAHDILVTIDNGSTASSTGATSGATLDMTGYEGVVFIGWCDTSGASSVLYAQVGNNTGTATGASGMEPVKGYADFTNSSIGILDVYRPNGRYVNGVLWTQGKSAKRRALVSIQYGAKNRPTSYSTNTNVAFTASPSTGAATAS